MAATFWTQAWLIVASDRSGAVSGDASPAFRSQTTRPRAVLDGSRSATAAARRHQQPSVLQEVPEAHREAVGKREWPRRSDAAESDGQQVGPTAALPCVTKRVAGPRHFPATTLRDWEIQARSALRRPLTRRRPSAGEVPQTDGEPVAVDDSAALVAPVGFHHSGHTQDDHAGGGSTSTACRLRR